mmetsp:Transcript_72411/g.193027  ORF Transcript_72411/g.193027 Transcript_72411/m.193027 type:complete len:249 (+) Transcript_72411:1255-2001(+)
MDGRMVRRLGTPRSPRRRGGGVSPRRSSVGSMSSYAGCMDPQPWDGSAAANFPRERSVKVLRKARKVFQLRSNDSRSSCPCAPPSTENRVTATSPGKPYSDIRFSHSTSKMIFSKSSANFWMSSFFSLRNASNAARADLTVPTVPRQDDTAISLFNVVRRCSQWSWGSSSSSATVTVRLARPPVSRLSNRCFFKTPSKRARVVIGFVGAGDAWAEPGASDTRRPGMTSGWGLTRSSSRMACSRAGLSL